jgi:hypothetical protein
MNLAAKYMPFSFQGKYQTSAVQDVRSGTTSVRIEAGCMELNPMAIAAYGNFLIRISLYFSDNLL